MATSTHRIDIHKIDSSIKMLETYIQDSDIEPLLVVLRSMKKDPENTSLLKELTETLATFGILQGAILTYAPYICILVSDDLFED